MSLYSAAEELMNLEVWGFHHQNTISVDFFRCLICEAFSSDVELSRLLILKSSGKMNYVSHTWNRNLELLSRVVAL